MLRGLWEGWLAEEDLGCCLVEKDSQGLQC